MPRVTFTANLRRLVDCPAAEVPGATVGEALEAVFTRTPQLRGYIVDDQGALRRHVVALKRCGRDAQSNMARQTREDARNKDRWE